MLNLRNIPTSLNQHFVIIPYHMALDDVNEQAQGSSLQSNTIVKVIKVAVYFFFYSLVYKPVLGAKFLSKFVYFKFIKKQSSENARANASRVSEKVFQNYQIRYEKLFQKAAIELESTNKNISLLFIPNNDYSAAENNPHCLVKQTKLFIKKLQQREAVSGHRVSSKEEIIRTISEIKNKYPFKKIQNVFIRCHGSENRLSLAGFNQSNLHYGEFSRLDAGCNFTLIACNTARVKPDKIISFARELSRLNPNLNVAGSEEKITECDFELSAERISKIKFHSSFQTYPAIIHRNDTCVSVNGIVPTTYPSQERLFHTPIDLQERLAAIV